MNNAAEIAGRLADHIEALAAEMLPGGRRDGYCWRAGSVAGEAGDSLSVIFCGERRGRWKDFATDEGGDPLDLVAACLFSGDLSAALSWARGWLGIGDSAAPQPARRPPPPPAPEASPVDKLDRARRLLARTVPILGTPAERYLEGRGLVLPRSYLFDPQALRFAPDVYHWPTQQRLPCMVAPIVGITSNELQGLHLTFIRPDGSGKADVEKARLYHGPKAGGCVKLMGDPEVTMGLAIGEGIETSLTALVAGYAAWACLDAGNLAAFPILPGIEALTVLADHDPAGLAAAQKVAARWREAGREVRVIAPDVPGRDWNDELKGAAHA